MTATQQTDLDKLRIVSETDLPHDCGLIAAAACSYLSKHGVKARVLCYGWGKNKGHRVVVFQSGQSLAVYDERGTRSMHHATWDSPPKAIAKALMVCDRDNRKVTKAQWE